jgi:hypothetical protein
MLVNPDDPAAEVITTAVENTAHDGGYKLIIRKATKEDDIDAAFATMDHQKPIALMVIAEPFFITRREKLVPLSPRWNNDLSQCPLSGVKRTLLNARRGAKDRGKHRQAPEQLSRHRTCGCDDLGRFHLI